VRKNISRSFYLFNPTLIFLWFVSWQCNLGGLECLKHLIANFQLNGSGLKHEKLTKKNIHNLAINGFRRLTAQFWLISVFLFPVSASLTTYLFGLFVWRIWFISFDSKLDILNKNLTTYLNSVVFWGQKEEFQIYVRSPSLVGLVWSSLGRNKR
jgi:hypothetical protein